MDGGGSSGGGSQGGGMPGGGMPGGEAPSGGSTSGGGGTVGGVESMGGVEAPAGAGAGAGEDDCVGVQGGIGGDIDCEGAGGAGGEGGANGEQDEQGAGGVGEFPSEGDADAIGKELDESIGGFDEVLMEEQREVQSVGRNTEGFGSGGSTGSSGGISLGEQAAGAMGSGGGGGGVAGFPGEVTQSPIESMSAEEIAQRTPDDIEVLVDDDIIAKQLREAALVEEDPELRERLWEEYRKYRGID